MKRETSNVLVALLLGAVAGGVAALLFAPASGSETRTKIKDTYRRAKEKAFCRGEEAEESADTPKEAVQEAYHRARKKSSVEAQLTATDVKA